MSAVVAVPIGEYNNALRVNLGSNHWGFKPELGASHRFKRWYLEAYSGVWFFTDNTDFLGTSTLSQAPIYSVQAHVTYIFPSKAWIAVDGLYVNGGETTVNGQPSADLQKNWRLGATFSMPLWRGHSIKILFHSGVATRAGGDFDIASLAYQYTWF